MKRLVALLFVFTLLCSSFVVAQEKPAGPPIRAILNGYTGWVEGELIPATEAMPADKFDYAPTQGEFKGVRTFGQQAKHIGDANYMQAAAILGEKPPVDIKAELKSKDEIVKYLKDSFAYAHKAIDSITEQNAFAEIPSPFDPNGKTSRVGVAVGITAHPWDHYGQMVEYLRLNNIIPPASRPKK